LKIKGKWHYWFVVLDKETGLPVLSSLLTSLSGSATKFIALKLKAIGKIPTVIITDGLPAYQKMFKGVIHQVCIFHHQQGISRFLRERFQTKEEQQKPIAEISVTDNPAREMKKVFQTNDKRTVKRRLQKLEKEAQDLGIADWVKQTKQKLSNLLNAVGSRRIPRTNNAIERFFRQFNRFYKTKCGFFPLQAQGTS